MTSNFYKSPTEAVSRSQQQQSPINLQSDTVFTAALKPIDISGWQPAIHGAIVSAVNSEAASVSDVLSNIFKISTNENHILVFGDNKARLEQIHFHSRSEHTIDGEDFDAELHFVHKIVREESDGLNIEPSTYLVIGLLINFHQAGPQLLAAGPKRRLKLELSDLLKVGAPAENEFPRAIIEALQAVLSDFYFYRGSLTGGEHPEIVSWLIPVKAVNIMGELAEIADAEQDTRELQPLNRRFVLQSRQQFKVKTKDKDNSITTVRRA